MEPLLGLVSMEQIALNRVNELNKLKSIFLYQISASHCFSPRHIQWNARYQVVLHSPEQIVSTSAKLIN